MNVNISTGGLICGAQDKLLLADIRHYSGTHMQSRFSGDSTLLEGVFWFMNPRGDLVYYSDQSRGTDCISWIYYQEVLSCSSTVLAAALS